jgi:DNA-binding beta-propeller fold protein YncE
MASLLAGLVSLAYGRERVLQSPTHLTTDSRQRLIVTDPDLPAVHVLNSSGKNSFRIAGGLERRLQMPTGVATDADDNIYVADGKKGVVLVYDPEGRFLHYIGNFQNESMFQSPAGMAIDRKAGHLYVVDPPAGLLVMLDLKGTVLKKTGVRRPEPNRVHFDDPTEIALGQAQVLVLDSAGSRVQIFDRQCNFQEAFVVRAHSGPPLRTEIGLALDGASNIYLSNLLGSTVRIYGRNGAFLGVLGKNGAGEERFNLPSGLWIDPAGRMYVADTRNSRVQVFRGAALED